MMGENYTDEELKLLRDMSKSPQEVSQIIGRSANSIRRKRQRIRIEDDPNLPVRANGRRRIDLNDDEMNVIADENYSIEEAAAKLGISYATVRNRRLELQGKNPYDHKKREPKKSQSIYSFNLNEEIAAAWLDTPEELDKKVIKIGQLYNNLKNTRDMRVANENSVTEC